MRKRIFRPNQWGTSCLTCWLECPLKFYFVYVLRLPRPFVNENLAFGLAIHYMLHRFFKVKFKTVQNFTKSWAGFWLGAVNGKHGPGGYKKPPVKINFRKDSKMFLGLGINILQTFWKQNIPLRDNPARCPITEKRFRFSIGSLILNGVWDRLQPLTNKEMAIIDYKTSIFVPSVIQRLADRQFTIYQMAFREKYGREPRKMEIWLLNNQGIQIIDMPLRTIAAFTELVRRVKEANRELTVALRSGYFEARVGRHCGQCEYQDKCFEYIQTNLPQKGRLVHNWLVNISQRSQGGQLIIPGLG